MSLRNLFHPFVIAFLLTGIPAAAAETTAPASSLNSLNFRIVHGDSLKVILRIEGTSPNSQLRWASSPSAIEPEVLDPEGKPLAEAASPQSADPAVMNFTLPVNAVLEWPVSSNATEPADPPVPSGHYRLKVAGHQWFIPAADSPRYSLRLRVHGDLFGPSRRWRPLSLPVLFDLPPTPIKVEGS